MILPNLLLYKTSHEMGIGHTLYSLFIIPQNFPLWFLRCLFFVYIIYFCLCKSITNIITRIVICFCISIIIWFINPYLKQHLDTFSYHAIYSSNIISSFFVLPFIAIAEYLRSKGLLEMNLSIKKKFMLLIIFIALWITCITSNFDLLFENYSNNILLFYISSFSGIFIILIISNILKKIIYISYMGRYSLIVLGLHILLITTIKGLYPTISPMNITIIVLSLSPLLIFFFKKYFPYFTAQKELIKCQ